MRVNITAVRHINEDYHRSVWLRGGFCERATREPAFFWAPSEILSAKRAAKNNHPCRLVRAGCAPTTSNPFYLSLLFTQSGCAIRAGENAHAVLGERVSLGSDRRGLGEVSGRQFEFRVEENPSPSLGMHDPVF